MPTQVGTITTDIRDHDRGFSNVVRQLTGLRELYADAGILGDADVKPGRATNGKQAQRNSADQVKIAAAHEFGIGVPERSFVRSTADEKGKSWQELAERGVAGIVDGRLTAMQVIGLVGLKMEADIKRKIRTGPFEPLKPATLRAKKPRTKPLIDTGRMLNSVTHRVGETK